MNRSRLLGVPAVAPGLALALACIGFALAGPLGLLVAVALAASAALPWPLPFALGQIGAAAVFGTPATATPPLAFLAVQAGLWTALALAHVSATPTFGASGVGGRVRAAVATSAVPLAVGSSVAVGLLVVLGAWTQGSLLAKAGVVAIVIAALLYGVHRYERVTTGLVTE